MTSALLRQRAAMIHGLILDATRDLSDAQLTRWLAPTAPPPGWHLWHIARSSDRVHAILPRMVADDSRPRQEIWQSESLAERWMLEPPRLGYGQTGAQMGDDAARAMTLPGNAALQEYARRAFAAVEAVFDTVDDDRLQRRGRDLVHAGLIERDVSVGEAILIHLLHASRHLGTIEGLRGVILEKPGSTTF